MSNAYQQSGVDIEKGYESVERIKGHVERTMRKEVLNQLGSFGALFKLDLKDYTKPVLVSGTDGVGTKILLAQQSGILNTIGIDCVAMCVNDILAQGAEPLFFLDYLAVGQNDPQAVEAIVSGVAEGCVQAGAALVGGETAEMPDLYAKEEFDLAGFSVGMVEEDLMLDGSQVQADDILIGLPSSGIHSNGYSLVRKIFFKDHDYDFNTQLKDGRKLIDHLLTPTKIYVKEVFPLVKERMVHGIAHITGGGFIENVPRMFNQALTAVIDIDAYELGEIFKLMEKLGQLDRLEMYNIFNMGIGMVLAVSPDHAEEVLSRLPDAVKLGQMEAQATEGETIRLVRGQA